jgi:glycosyltransferase involved in cell wall biosynthesis
MTSPLISVITVSYNSAKTIARTLDSLKNQTCSDFESIVVDGGSTDDTREIIKSFGERVNHFISEPDQGIYDAMNKGIDLSSGTYIAFLNSDDYYLPNTFQLISEQVNDADIYFGNMIKERELNGKVFRRTERPDISRMKETMSIFHPSVFAKRDLFQLLGKFSLDYSLAADYHWLLRAYLNDANFKHIDEVLSVFTIGGVSNYSCKSYSEAAAIQHELGLPNESMLELNRLCKSKMRRNRLVSKIAQLPVFKSIYENRIKKRWS